MKRLPVELMLLTVLLAGCEESPMGLSGFIGHVAPEISGKDTDGTPFRLSDYRGRVVMLDFWGDW